MKTKYALPIVLFFHYAAAATLFPYLPLYLSAFVTPGEIGVLMAVTPVVMILFQPIWDKLADRFGIKPILLINIGLSVVSTIGFIFAKTFVAMLLVLSAYSMFIVAILPLVDTLILTLHQDQYGKLRLWGSMGYGVAVFLSGLFKTSILGFWSFIIHMLLMMICLLVVMSIPKESLLINPTRAGSNREKPGKFQAEPLPYKSKRFLLLMASCFFIGMVLKAFESFFTIGLDKLNASDFLMGTSWVLELVPEVILFFLIDRVASRFTPKMILSTGIACYIVRMAILFSFPVLWVWVVSQTLASAAFCFWYFGAVKTMNQWLSDNQRTRGNALFSAVSFGVGGTAGNLLSGYTVEQFGVFTWFGIAALLCLAALVLSLFLREKKSLTGSQKNGMIFKETNDIFKVG